MGLPKINYLCIVMYKQLTSEQRSQIFALLQRKSPRKEIAHIVGISQSTLSRELKRNSSLSGKYVWLKAHDKGMERRKRSTSNAALAPELVWRIKQAIIDEQWSPRQISGVLKKEGVSVSHQSIYNIIHADATGELASHTRHKLKYRYRPKCKASPIACRTSIHQRPKEANGKRFGDFEMDLIVDRYKSRYPHHRGAFHQHALHNEAAAWEKVRAIGQRGTQAAATLQETYKDHHHRQWS